MLLRPEVSQTVARAVLVTGAARSGTTLMGQLLHTLVGVEYLYEPPLLFALLPLLKKRATRRSWWRSLWETYLFEDFLMDAVAGRRLNFNYHDDSSVRRVKSPEEIEGRLNSQHRRPDLFSQALGHRIVFKMPDVLPWLPLLHRVYPDMKVVVMWREPKALIASLLAKGWYRPGVEGSLTFQGPWGQLGPDIPFWMPRDLYSQYLRAGELERLYLYYLQMYEGLEKLPWARVVDYDRLVAEPEPQLDRICRYIGERQRTPQTEEVLQTVRQIDAAPPAHLYLPPQEQLSRVRQVIETALALAEMGEEYKPRRPHRRVRDG